LLGHEAVLLATVISEPDLQKKVKNSGVLAKPVPPHSGLIPIILFNVHTLVQPEELAGGGVALWCSER